MEKKSRLATRSLENVCRIEGCDRACWREVCQLHARHIRWGVLPPQFGIEPNPACTVGGCDTPSYSKTIDMCKAHHTVALQGRDPASKRAKARNGQPSLARRAGYEPVPAELRALQPCLAEGCATTTRATYCAYHLPQFEEFGITWNGRRPAEVSVAVLEQRRASAPECAVSRCDSRATSKKSRLCRTHRGDRNRKNCSIDFYVEMMSIEACQSCGRDDVPLCTDHDHSHDWAHPYRDGMCETCIRGRLCNGCNTALGLLGEDAGRIRALVDYLEQARPVPQSLAA